jgi:sarcosine oxidase subunit alpha
MAISVKGTRLNGGVQRGQRVEITVDGKPVLAYRGETIATALIAAGHWVCRTKGDPPNPMGVYCNIGVCHSCLMTVNGERNVRICMTPVSAGCVVETQRD